MTEHTIELVRPQPPFAEGDFFDRGERIIMVDGKRWGRTHCKGHGVWGMSHHFEQQGGDMLMRDPADTETWKDYKWLRVDSDRKRRYDTTKARDTFEIVLEKVRELVAAGRLRDPEIVKAEADKRHEEYRIERAAEQAESDRQFRAKALEAAGYRAEPNDPQSLELVTRIIAAMEWAASH